MRSHAMRRGVARVAAHVLLTAAVAACDEAAADAVPEGTQSVRFRFGDSRWWSAGQGAMATGFGIWSR